MLIEVTRDFLKYRECMLAIWRDITKRLEPDWDVCDAFADIGGTIFELTIGDKYNIENAVWDSKNKHRRKEFMKKGRVMLLTVCVGSTVAVMLWLGGLRRIDCELKPGESLIVCFPYEERKLSIGYISKDKSISEDTTTCTVVKNTATRVEKRVSGKGNYGRTKYGAIIMNANTEYLISLQTDKTNAVSYTIILEWPCRLSDIFFKGFRVLSSASEFVKIVKTDI